MDYNESFFLFYNCTCLWILKYSDLNHSMLRHIQGLLRPMDCKSQLSLFCLNNVFTQEYKCPENYF